MTAFLAVLAVGLGTFVSRSVFILALARRRIPDGILIALQFVAPAVLGALIVALLTRDDGTVAIGIAELAAFAVGGAVAFKTRSHILTLFAGMTIFWVTRALI